MNLRNKKIELISILLLVVSLIATLFPIFWMVSTALKPRNELFAIPPNIIPIKPTFSNFWNVITNPEIGRFFFNSIFITVTTVFIALTLAILAAYSLSRISLPGKNTFLLFLLSSQMFPYGMLLIGIYVMLAKLSLLNSFLSIIIAFLALLTPVSIWLLKTYFDSIPTELDEAARIDGCTRLQALYKVILPVSKPGIISVGVYIALSAWNEYLFTFTIVQNNKYFTLPVGVDYLFRGEFSFAWDQLMAASLLMSLPITSIFLIFQKGIIKGLTAGALKQ